MRIIAGRLRSRKLKQVPSKNTRSTSDKVKESVFQMLGPFFKGGNCLDLFAGSGSLGLEAMSRGMEKAIFIDNNIHAVRTVRENIKNLKLEKETELYKMSAFKALSFLTKKEIKFDLVFLDPPYGKINFNELIQKMINYKLLNEHCYIYCEHSSSEQINIDLSSVKIKKQTNYSKTISVTLLQYEAE